MRGSVYIAQSKWSTMGTGSPALGDVQKFLKGFEDLINAEFDRFNDKVRAKQTDLEQALADPGVQFVLVFAHSGQQPLSEPARHAIENVLKDVNDPIETASFTMLSQAELHTFLAHSAHGKAPDLTVTLHDWGSTQEPYAAFYGQVEASAVAEWYKKYNVRLFAKNLRQFLGRGSDVNDSLIDTLVNDLGRFWYFNNGITVLCEKVEKTPYGGTSKKTGRFEFRGASVVNGAQTVGCIGQAAQDHPDAIADARVPARFISLEGCPPDFAGEVTRATNTQNRVERRDFVALDPQQDRLATELAIDQKRYAIKSGEKPPPPESGCTIIEATIALACAHFRRRLCSASQARNRAALDRCRLRERERNTVPPTIQLWADRRQTLEVCPSLPCHRGGARGRTSQAVGTCEANWCPWKSSDRVSDLSGSAEWLTNRARHRHATAARFSVQPGR